MKFSLFDVMDKGLYLKQALQEAGHEPVDDYLDADLLLLDCDWAWAPARRQLAAGAVAAGVKVALYPHGGLPTVFVYDGLTDADPNVTLRLEHGRGSIDVADSLGLDLLQEAPGWLYCPTRPFERVDEPRHVLFAPQHPNIEALQTGSGEDTGPGFNNRVYRGLLELGFDLTVSLVGPAWRNGVYPHPRAHATANPTMRFTQMFQLIQEADVVVAAGTAAAAAVACGKPLVMLGGHDCCDYIDGGYRRAAHADEYEHLFRYPLNAEDGDLGALIEAACEGTDEAAAWRKRWIGDDGTGQAVRLLEHLVGDTETEASRHVAIEGVTARATSRGA